MGAGVPAGEVCTDEESNHEGEGGRLDHTLGESQHHRDHEQADHRQQRND